MRYKGKPLQYGDSVWKSNEDNSNKKKITKK